MSVKVTDRTETTEGSEDSETPVQWSSDFKRSLVLFSYSSGGVKFGHNAIELKLQMGSASMVASLLTCVLTIPLTYMEMSIGQYSRKTMIQVWDCCPFFRGIGWGCLILFLVNQMYFSVQVMTYLFYMVASCSSEVPWTRCNPEWATINCYTYETNMTARHQCYEKLNKTTCDAMIWMMSADQFYSYRFKQLNRPPLSPPPIDLVLYTAVVMLIVALINSMSTRTIEMFLIFLVVVPTIQIVVLLFISLVDPGGLATFGKSIIPIFTNFMEPEMWKHMLVAHTYSMGLGLGAFITIASRFPFRTLLHTKSIALNVLDRFDGFLHLMVALNLFGTLCYHTHQDVHVFASLKEDNVFAKLAQALLFISVGPNQIWTFLFYSCGFCMSLRRMVLLVYVDSELLAEQFKFWRGHSTIRVFLISGTIFAFSCTWHIPQVVKVIGSFRHVTMYACVQIFVALQMAAVVYVYGIGDFLDDAHFMTGVRAPFYYHLILIVGTIVYLINFCFSAKYTFEFGISTPIKMNCNVLPIRADRSRPDPWPKDLLFVRCLVRHKRIINKTDVASILTPFVYFLAPLIVVILFACVHTAKSLSNKQVKMCGPAPSWRLKDPVLERSRQMFAISSITNEYMYRQSRLKDDMVDDDERSDNDV